MKAYNETWVENRANKLTLNEWFKNGLISQAELEKYNEEVTEDFYDPNWFIKIGLFFFTGIAVSFSSGIFLVLFSLGSNNIAMGVFLVIFSVLAVIVLEHFIKRNKLYRSGIDNALLYSAIGFLFTGILSTSLFSDSGSSLDSLRRSISFFWSFCECFLLYISVFKYLFLGQNFAAIYYDGHIGGCLFYFKGSEEIHLLC
jgi:hypothetical protein